MKVLSKQITLACLLFFYTITAIAQNQAITLAFKDTPVGTVLESIEKQVGKSFFYENDVINLTEKVSISVQNATLKAVLDQLFNNKITFSQTDQHIVLKAARLNSQTVATAPTGPDVASTAANSTSTGTGTANPPINIVRGVVTDQEGETLPGAIIKVKDNNKKTAVADVNGQFELTDVPGNATLVVSFLGFKNTEYSVNNRAQVEIILQNDAVELEEVLVTGYGTFKKSAYAGSASVIRAEKLEDVPVLSVNDLLMGNAPGVTIASGSSQPGAPNTIRIRGVGSFNASKAPLYVIDGIPVLSGNVSSISSISSIPPGTDIMSTLNISDVENIVVIKDAAAASLYGSRAANGVILITTKSGKKGKAAFNVKADMGFSNFAMPYRTVMGGQERRDLIMEGLRNE